MTNWGWYAIKPSKPNHISIYVIRCQLNMVTVYSSLSACRVTSVQAYSLNIHECISICETCKFATEHPKEALMSHSIPDRLWRKVGIDPFQFWPYWVPCNSWLFWEFLGNRSTGEHYYLNHHPEMESTHCKIQDSILVDFQHRAPVYNLII